jgi:hypothetical protein
MKRDEILSLVIFGLLGTFLLVGVHEALWSLNDILTYGPYFIIAGMIGVLIWGFRERIETTVKGRKPAYVVSLAQEPEDIRMREIRVRLAPTDQVRNEQARFYVVSLGVPSGAEDATEVQPCFKYPKTNDLYPLVLIPSSGKPWIHATWPAPPTAPEFDKRRDDFATALVLDKTIRIEKMNLGAGHALQPFILLFTVRGRNTIYFPAENLVAFDMPTKFQTELLLQAKGRPLVRLKSFEIEARSWETVLVTELRNPSGS